MKLCKSLLTVALVMVATSTATLTAHAEVFGRNSVGHSFTSDWETKEDLVLHGQKVGECVYGFDARAILSDLDYAKCYIVDHRARASVAPRGVIAAESGWSYQSAWTEKVTCKHGDTPVTYYFESQGTI